LGETELGLPFYLDVRLFELKGTSAEEILAWHLNVLQEGREAFKVVYETENRKIYQGQGYRLTEPIDPSHGFAAVQGERGIYLDYLELEERLFVIYAEAPLKTFEKHTLLFQKLYSGF